MSRYRNNDRRCPVCGLAYRDLRTGYSFADVRQMLWSYSEDPHDWPRVSRGTVLGKWHELKLREWAHHLDYCAQESVYLAQRSDLATDLTPF